MEDEVVLLWSAYFTADALELNVVACKEILIDKHLVDLQPLNWS